MQAKLQLILDSTQYKAEAQASAREIGKLTAANKLAESAIKAQGTAMREAATVARAQAAAQAEAARASAAVAQAQLAATRAANAQAAAAQSANRANASLTSTMNQLKGAVIGYLSVATARRVLEQADAMTLLSARTMVAAGSTQAAAYAQRELFAMAQRNGVALGDLTSVYARLQMAARENGVSQRQVLDVTQALTLAARVSGATQQEAASAMLQFGQAMGSGRLAGEEFRAISESMPIVLTLLSKELGVSRGALKEMAAAGQLETIPVMTALSKSLKELQDTSAQFPETFSQGLTKVTNALSVMLDKLNQSYGITSKLAALFTSIGEVAAYSTGPRKALDDVEAQQDLIRNRLAKGLTASGAPAGMGLGDTKAAVAQRLSDAALAMEAARANQVLPKTLSAYRELYSLELQRLSLLAAERLEYQAWVQSNRDANTAPPVTTGGGPSRALVELSGGQLLRRGQGDERILNSWGDRMLSPAQFLARSQAEQARLQGYAIREFVNTPLSSPDTLRLSRNAMTDNSAIQVGAQEAADRIEAQMKAAQEATDRIIENLTRGFQSAVTGLADGLMTTGLRSARDFSSALGAAIRRVIAEAIAAGFTSRFLQPLIDTIGGQLARGSGVGGGVTSSVVSRLFGGGAGGTTAGAAASAAGAGGSAGVAGSAAAGASAAGASWMGPAAIAALAITAAVGRGQQIRGQREIAESQFRNITSSFEGRRLRLAGRDREAEAADLQARQREQYDELEAARQAELRANRDGGGRLVWTLAQQRKREKEINDRYRKQFEALAELQRSEAAKAAGAPRGTIGDFNAPGSLNVAALVGAFGRPVASAPTVAPTPGGTGAAGFTIVINGDVTTQAKDAPSFVRELQRLSQQQYGTPARWAEALV